MDTCRSALRRVGSVSYSVIFAIDLDAVPESVRREVERVFLEIADAVETIPHASPFFTSMDDSVLQIDVEGWRIGYRLDPKRQEVRVIEASQIRRR